MANPLVQAGAAPEPTQYAPLTMDRYITGIATNRSALRDAAVPYLQSKFYAASRYDSIWDGLNMECGPHLTLLRRPGTSIYNNVWFPPIKSFFSFSYIQDNQQQIRVMVDTSGAVYDGTPGGKINIWNKSAKAGATRFLGVGPELFFANGAEAKKWVQSSLSWAPDTLFDGQATSGTTLGDFIIDSNQNIQQAVGGFNLLIANVAIQSNVLTLTLDTSQLSDPTGTPVGTPSATGGTIPAGNNYIRICAVDPTGNTTQAGNESEAVATTGATSQIAWSWPAVSGAVGYRIYVGNGSGTEDSYFVSASNSFTQTQPTSNFSGTPPTADGTSVNVPSNLYAMKGVQLSLNGLTAASFLNGTSIQISGVLPGGQASTSITATFVHADYASAPDTGNATSGSGITGAVAPTWQTALWAVTSDGGAQWINRGSYVQNWGIATPAAAPTVFQSVAPATYPSWSPNTTYWASGFVYNLYQTPVRLFQLTTPGTTGTSQPAWDSASVGATTTDGSAIWTYQGEALWKLSTSYAKGAFVLGVPSTGNLDYVYQAQNAGTSGATQPNWVGGIGTQVVDGGITWICLGATYEYDNNGDAYRGGWFGPSRAISNASIIVDSNGYKQQVQDPPSSGSSQYVPGPFVSGSVTPKWGVTGDYTAETLSTEITAFSIDSNNNATIVANNVFSAPQSVTLSGLAIGTYLNGNFNIQSTDFTSFSFPFLHAAVSQTTDGGTAIASEPNMWLNLGAYAPVATGATFYAYSYGNSVTGHVGTSSAPSRPVTLLAGNLANVQGFGSADPQVDTVWLWATAIGGATLIFMDKIANPGGGVPFTYQRTMPDVSSTGGPQLNALIAAPIALTNNPPTSTSTAPAFHMDRIWMADGSYVKYSGGPDTLVGSGNEAFPPINFFQFPGKVIRLVPVTVNNGGLLVMTTSGIKIILGTGTSNNPFFWTNYADNIGVLSYDCVDVVGSTLHVFTSAGKQVALDPSSGYTETGFFIGDQFEEVTTGFGAAGGGSAALYSPDSTYVTWHEQKTGDTALYVSDGNVGWFRYSPVTAPESGSLWSPRAAIEGGTSAVQSIETAPGVKTLLIGPGSAGGPITMRDSTVNADNGVVYNNTYVVIGSIQLALPGQIAEIAMIALDSIRIGTSPTVGLLLGEVNPTAQVGFDMLEVTANDPPILPPSATLYSERYVALQNGICPLCRHFQLLIQWVPENAPNELLTHTIYGAKYEERTQR